MRGRFAALFAVFCGVTAPRVLRAEEVSSVTVVSPADAGPLAQEAATRLGAELRAAGFSVRLVQGAPGADGRSQVESTAARELHGDGIPDPLASVVFLKTERSAVAEVWVADHVTKKTLVRRVEIGDAATSNAASDLAVRAVELLRASLLEVREARRQTMPVGLRQWIAESAPPLPPAPASRVASLEAGLSVLGGGDFGLAPTPIVRVGLELPRSLSLRAFVAPSVGQTSLNASSGAVALRQTVAAADFTYAFGLQKERVHPVISLGGGLYYLQVDGHATAPYQGDHETFFAAAFVGGGGLDVRLLPGLAALVDVQLVALSRQPAVTVLGVETGRAGRPAFLPSLGLVAHF
jgi:hypothetical protein